MNVKDVVLNEAEHFEICSPSFGYCSEPRVSSSPEPFEADLIDLPEVAGIASLDDFLEPELAKRFNAPDCEVPKETPCPCVFSMRTPSSGGSC